MTHKKHLPPDNQTDIKLLTLCLVLDNNRILLGMKKRGFGAGKYNGFGGKVHENETFREAALRELTEEVSLSADEKFLNKCAVLNFIYTNQPAHEVHVYILTDWVGEPFESEEMLPRWFDYADIPYDEMWVDDAYWLPHILKGETLYGKFLFDGKEQIIDHELKLGVSMDQG